MGNTMTVYGGPNAVSLPCEHPTTEWNGEHFRLNLSETEFLELRKQMVEHWKLTQPKPMAGVDADPTATK